MQSAALFTLWLLLLVLSYVAPHEDRHQHVEFIDTPLSTENTRDYGSHPSDLVIQNVLKAFGINDTEFRTGQLMCPPTNLTGGYKEKTITIGMAGCLIDPLISQYTSRQRALLKMHYQDTGPVNCSATAGLAGYIPPIAGDIINMYLLHGRQIN